MEVRGWLHAQGRFTPREKIHQYKLNRRLALVVLKTKEVCCHCWKSKCDSTVIQPAASSVYRLSQTGSGGNIKQVSVRLWTGFSSFKDMIQFWAFVMMMMADFPVPKYQWILVWLNKYPPALGRQWRAVLCSHFYSAQAVTYSVSLTHRYSWIRFTCVQAAWRKFLNLQIANKLSFKMTSRLFIGNPRVRFMARALCWNSYSQWCVCVCVCVCALFKCSPKNTSVHTTTSRPSVEDSSLLMPKSTLTTLWSCSLRPSSSSQTIRY